MKIWAYLLSTLVTFVPAARAEMLTFMKENDANGKQIWLSNLDGSAVRQITTGAFWHLYPHLSSDGKSVVYVEGADGKSLRVVMQNFTQKITEEWTPDGGNNLHPTLSGDGRKMAFSSSPTAGANEQIGIIDLKKSRNELTPTHVSRDGVDHLVYHPTVTWIPADGHAHFPSLSSDGNLLVYHVTSVDGHKYVVLQDLRSGDKTNITDPSGKSMAPKFSFDSRRIVFTSFVNNLWDVYVYDRVSKRTTRITANSVPAGPAKAIQNFAPSFTPDGDIIFASNVSGNFLLYRASNQQTPIFNSTDSQFYAPSISGDEKIQQHLLAPIIGPARSSFGAVEHNGRVYVVGGHQGHEHTYPKESFLSSLEIYDVKSGKWHDGASRPNAAHGLGLAAYGNYVYAFGGFAYSETNDPQWKSLDNIDRYDIAQDKWVTIGKMPRARSSNAVVTVGDKVYLIGGWDSTPKSKGDADGEFHREIDVFDFTTETMTVSPFTLPDPLRRAFTGVERDGKIVLIGGIGKGAHHFQLMDSVTQFDPISGVFTELPKLPFPTFAPAAGVLNGSIYVFGGGAFSNGGAEFYYVDHIFALKVSGPWTHSGSYLSENKGFPAVVNLSPTQLGVLGGHSYDSKTDGPVTTFETFGY